MDEPRSTVPAGLLNRLLTTAISVGIRNTKSLSLNISGILWRVRTGAPWRDLPPAFGPWKTVYNQFNRWSKAGHWEKIFLNLKADLDNEWNFIDGTIVKAHQHASGALGSGDQDIGKSRGGNTTKIHMLADAHGNPIKFIISGGNVHDIARANELTQEACADLLVADKGYDSESYREEVRRNGISPVIPRRSNSLKPNPEFDRYLYRHRHLIENLFAKLKHFRAISTRYDKLSRNFAAVVCLGCILIWLKL